MRAPRFALTAVAIALALALLACNLTFTGGSMAVVSDTPSAPGTGTSAPDQHAATVTEIVNDVTARPAVDLSFVPAVEGYVMHVGGELRTGSSSKARLGLTDGTIVRVGSETAFTLTDVRPTGNNLLTQLQLQAGMLWVSLVGGEVDVQTPVGVAAARGSFARFAYDAATRTLTIQCLEGICRASNDKGAIDLGTLQGTILTDQGPGPLIQLSDQDVQDFIAQNPDVGAALAATLTALPTTTGTPTATATPTATSTPTATATRPRPTRAPPTNTPVPTLTATPSDATGPVFERISLSSQVFYRGVCKPNFITVTAHITDPNSVVNILLWYRVGSSGPYTSVGMDYLGDWDYQKTVNSADVAGNEIGTWEFYITAQDGLGNPSQSPVDTSVTLATRFVTGPC